MKRLNAYTLFIALCPHCGKKVAGDDHICPMCDRWLLGDIDWSRDRKIRRGLVSGVSVMSAVMILYWTLIRLGVFPL